MDLERIMAVCSCETACFNLGHSRTAGGQSVLSSAGKNCCGCWIGAVISRIRHPPGIRTCSDQAVGTVYGGASVSDDVLVLFSAPYTIPDTGLIPEGAACRVVICGRFAVKGSSFVWSGGVDARTCLVVASGHERGLGSQCLLDLSHSPCGE